MFSFIFTFFLILHASASYAAYSTIQSLHEVKQHLENHPPEHILILLDIDNTLLHSLADLGSDQWVYDTIARHIADGYTYSQALELVLPLYFHINEHIDLECIEAGSTALVAAYKKAGMRVFCLTARSPQLINRTLVQLESNGFPFEKQSLITLMQSYHYQNEVLFCGAHDKGQGVIALLQHLSYQPKLIIFVDDKEKNLASVEKALAVLDIEFIGLRYAGCDERG